ncbi:cobalt-factor II C(20)-methyltransferase [Sporanaerobium hydrogeniformans]|uniref:cobalt-factor II C(20)-methyltransferase n=1 Tax=Sporanaerobium hydrogeniformans TaxID=3072179 RepID=UPI0026930154|nr:cobalt-factor II C(20)-methyltransferase [Sporanaerobium hydrogeniformans]
MAKFYGIGTGPGDPSLLTLKAVEVFHQLDVLYTPEAQKEGGSLAFSIAKPHLKEELLIKERHFPMTFNVEEKDREWQRVADEIIEDVKQGKNVGFITLGDPMIYSTYVYIMNKLKDQVAIETIPGISSFSNIASSQNFPLVMDKEPLIILPCTAEKEIIEEAMKSYSNLVLMKVYRHLESIVSMLEKYDLLKSAILVSNSSQEGETVYTDLSDIHLKEKISYFSTILVNRSNLG